MRGKGQGRLIYLRTDVADAVHAYLEARGFVRADGRGPLTTTFGNRAGGQRLNRRGVRKIVDGHQRRLDLKRPGVSKTPDTGMP